MARMAMDEVRKEIEENNVVIYMKGSKESPKCGFSAAAVQVLQSYGVSIKDVDILADPEKMQAVKQFTNWPTMPQIFLGGKFVGGCDIIKEMHAKGEIALLLQKAGATK